MNLETKVGGSEIFYFCFYFEKFTFYICSILLGALKGNFMTLPLQVMFLQTCATIFNPQAVAVIVVVVVAVDQAKTRLPVVTF